MARHIPKAAWWFPFVGCILFAGLVLSLAASDPARAVRGNTIRNADLPLTITRSGGYTLGEEISATGGGITISVSNVTIDLAGFTLGGGTGDGISVGVTGLKNIVVKNGRIRGWGGHGIDLDTSTPSSSQILDVVSEGNGADGIRVFTGSLLSGCTASGNGEDGIQGDGDGGTIVDCTTSSNGGDGFALENGAWSVSHCSAVSNTGNGISAEGEGTNVLACASANNKGSGIRMQGPGTITSSTFHNNGDSVGDVGIFASEGVNVLDTVASNNFSVGIAVQENSTVRGCTASANRTVGIDTTGDGNLIEDNHVIGNLLYGIAAESLISQHNFIVHNMAHGNGTDYSLATGNSYGVINTGSASFSNSNSWANYKH